jgi:hypothetical protein
MQQSRCTDCSEFRVAEMGSPTTEQIKYLVSYMWSRMSTMASDLPFPRG